MALEDTFEVIINSIENIVSRLTDLESLSQDTGSIQTGKEFPENATNNRIFILTGDTTGGPGGTLYRYDSATNTWLRVS